MLIASDPVTVTVTVAGAAETAPALSTALYVNENVPVLVGVNVTTPFAGTGWAPSCAGQVTICALATSVAPSGSVSFAITFTLFTLETTAPAASLTATWMSFT